MSKRSVPERSRHAAAAREGRGLLIVGRPQTAAVWQTWSAAQNLRCIDAADVHAALDHLSRISPIALVVSSTLEEPSLHDFCERVRQHDAFRYAPIVASGPGDEALQRRSREAGADAYVPAGDALVLDRDVRHWIRLGLELEEKVASRRPPPPSPAPRRRRSDHGSAPLPPRVTR